jgi:hypothetical protein
VRTSVLAETLGDADTVRSNKSLAGGASQAQRSQAAAKKQTGGATPDGPPVHSFHTLLADLRTMARDTIVTRSIRFIG